VTNLIRNTDEVGCVYGGICRCLRWMGDGVWSQAVEFTLCFCHESGFSRHEGVLRYIYFFNKSYHFFTFDAIWKDNGAINVIALQYRRDSSLSNLMGMNANYFHVVIDLQYGVSILCSRTSLYVHFSPIVKEIKRKRLCIWSSLSCWNVLNTRRKAV
jgi:hypothetical protein